MSDAKLQAFTQRADKIRSGAYTPGGSESEILVVDLLLHIAHQLKEQTPSHPRITEQEVLAAKERVTRPSREYGTFIPHLSTGALVDGLAAIESEGKLAKYLVMHPRQYACVRKFARDVLDIENRAEVLKWGAMGYIYGAILIMDRTVPENVFYVVDEALDHSLCFTSQG